MDNNLFDDLLKPAELEPAKDRFGNNVKIGDFILKYDFALDKPWPFVYKVETVNLLVLSSRPDEKYKYGSVQYVYAILNKAEVHLYEISSSRHSYLYYAREQDLPEMIKIIAFVTQSKNNEFTAKIIQANV